MLYNSLVCCSCLFSDFSRFQSLRLEAKVKDCSPWMDSVAFAMACTVDLVAVFISAAFILAVRLIAAVSFLIWAL
jgi:hypothetical protein